MNQNRLKLKNGTIVKEGDWITLNGTKGFVYENSLPLVAIDLEKNKSYQDLMKLVDKIKVMGVRTNAETPGDAAQGVEIWCGRDWLVSHRTYVLW
jgi:pyruvate,orthophosphate dikinase